MKYGIYISNYALNGDPRLFVQLAKAAEDAYWDGSKRVLQSFEIY